MRLRNILALVVAAASSAGVDAIVGVASGSDAPAASVEPHAVRGVAAAAAAASVKVVNVAAGLLGRFVGRRCGRRAGRREEQVIAARSIVGGGTPSSFSFRCCCCGCCCGCCCWRTGDGAAGPRESFTGLGGDWTGLGAGEGTGERRPDESLRVPKSIVSHSVSQEYSFAKTSIRERREKDGT
jgi:hypothetical protein